MNDSCLKIEDRTHVCSHADYDLIGVSLTKRKGNKYNLFCETLLVLSCFPELIRVRSPFHAL